MKQGKPSDRNHQILSADTRKIECLCGEKFRTVQEFNDHRGDFDQGVSI